MLFLCVLQSPLSSQNQTLADSLEAIYASGGYEGQDKLDILRDLAVNHTDTEKKLAFSNELVEAARALNSNAYVVKGYIEKGNALRLKSDFGHALESYFQAAKIAEEEKLDRDQGIIFIVIADIYSLMGNHDNAVKNYQRAIDMLREENDSVNVASALSNLGDEYFNHGELDSALLFFKESGEIFHAVNYEIGLAYNLGNVGLVYARQGKDALAEANINEAISIHGELQDYYPISVYLTYMSDIYLRQDDPAGALNYAQRSLEIARQYGLKEQISDASLKLSEIYEKTGAYLESLGYYKDYITFRDSVKNLQTIQQMADLRTDFEVSRKQAEIDLLEKEAEIRELKGKRQTYVLYASGVVLAFILILAFGLYRRYRFIRETKLVIEKEKDRSEHLLLNILPAETAQELKQNGRVQAKRFESVTVLFTDFQGFTHYAENLPPEDLVKSVDFYFSKFDKIMEKYGLEKIKTAGDAYMCAGGLPFLTGDHAVKMMHAALEIIEFVRSSKKQNPGNQARFDIRIGINTGPVVAGVVGTKKFAYDIWGDTVNIAAHMESASEPGKINLSENTYELVKDVFDCEYRGEIEVKNKGMMKMFYLMEPFPAG